MYRKLEALTKEKHQDLRFTSVQDFSFAETTSTVPLSFSEIALAARYFPVVFLNKGAMPVAILSLEKDKNSYVTPEKRWKVPYVPAFFRGYPFTLAKVDPARESAAASQKGDSAEKDMPIKEGDRYLFCIDRDSPHFQNPQGDLLFTANGDFTELVSKRLEFLKIYRNEMGITENLVRLMDDKGILVDRHFILNVNGNEVPVGGFRTVDLQRLNALDDTLLADWVRRGIVALITAHLNSLVGIPMGGK